MKLSALLDNINSILLNTASNMKVTLDDVDFIVHHIFKLDIPDETLKMETVEKIIAICSKYPEFKAYEQLTRNGLKYLRLLFDMKNRMTYERILDFKAFEAVSHVKTKHKTFSVVLQPMSQSGSTIQIDSKVKVQSKYAKHFDVYLKNTNQGNKYYFVAKKEHTYQPKTGIGPKKKAYWTYMYVENSGNIYRGHNGIYATQEIASNSHAFNKGNKNKMAIPNDFNAACQRILDNYLHITNDMVPELRDSEKLSKTHDKTGLFKNESKSSLKL